MTTPHAVVVGAGIGGLTAAAALHRTGWHITVLERAPALAPTGVCLGVAPNALRVLDQLGVGEPVRSRASVGGQGGIIRPDGRWLVRGDVDLIRRRFGDPVVLLRRTDLVDLVSALLPADALRTGTPVTGVQPGDAERPATVTTDAGSLDADLVVAADGIDSVLRGVLFPDLPGPRYVGYTTWRFIAPPLPATPTDGRPGGVGETWGPGTRFAGLPLADGHHYCYATANTPPGVRHDDERAELLRLFGAWHAPVPALIDAADPDGIVHTDVRTLPTPLPAYHSGRVAVLGDAAHPMTPDLGQGGCQAIEDAAVLAHVLGDASAADVPGRLATYTAQRRPRAEKIVRRSAATGRMAQVGGPVGVRLRAVALTLVGRLPDAVLNRGFDDVFGWQPPI